MRTNELTSSVRTALTVGRVCLYRLAAIAMASRIRSNVTVVKNVTDGNAANTNRGRGKGEETKKEIEGKKERALTNEGLTFPLCFPLERRTRGEKAASGAYRKAVRLRFNGSLRARNINRHDYTSRL